MAASKAFNAVFSTFELAEEILSNLTFRQLFQAQRVSRQFQAVIKGSKLLRRTMFLGGQLVSAPPGKAKRKANKAKGITQAPSRDIMYQMGTDTNAPNHINPLIRLNAYFLRFGSTSFECGLDADLLLRTFPPHGSWEQTYFTQPPYQDVYVSYRGERRYEVVFISSQEGVRLGQVLDQLNDRINKTKKLCKKKGKGRR